MSYCRYCGGKIEQYRCKQCSGEKAVMSDKGFTDDQIYAALRLRQDYDSNSDGVIDALAWAASEYLKAKAVIENISQNSPAVLCSYPPKDFAQYTAREYLNTLKKS